MYKHDFKIWHFFDERCAISALNDPELSSMCIQRTYINIALPTEWLQKNSAYCSAARFMMWTPQVSSKTTTDSQSLTVGSSDRPQAGALSRRQTPAFKISSL